ncbi:hypothetical protein CDD80_425 [Ophiocordyceps camponoti-rufipedis]|uniref:GH16 domain-containing protein n=1 Tax=Ophiocordyceps camponoti-rufipedis TaxID=2004952 RepID=A0A2C5YHQ4_9HYPO|nr:hypothetical protein CDD80_425 [Ophiocordyceps camponoti-rufipedis]
MISYRTLAALYYFLSAVSAWGAPNYGGFGRVWQETFSGPAGSSPNRGNWNIIEGNLGYNEELQRYTASNSNLQLTGGDTLQIIPRRDGGGWTSGRLESTYVARPSAGKVTKLEAVIRFGGNGVDRKKGIWPAFWVLGDSHRHGTPWPACGELDIMETVNGQLTGYGTVHCDVFPGGICNEGNGIGAGTGFPDQGWHTWSLEIDRRPGNWQDQSITWFIDGRQFHQVKGYRINKFDVWASLTDRPLYFILNLAVGGKWPGPPDGNTLDSFGSMMEVGYVAHYST